MFKNLLKQLQELYIRTRESESLEQMEGFCKNLDFKKCKNRNKSQVIQWPRKVSEPPSCYEKTSLPWLAQLCLSPGLLCAFLLPTSSPGVRMHVSQQAPLFSGFQMNSASGGEKGKAPARDQRREMSGARSRFLWLSSCPVIAYCLPQPSRASAPATQASLYEEIYRFQNPQHPFVCLRSAGKTHLFCCERQVPKCLLLVS